MMDKVLSIENITKKYRLGTISHRTLTHDLQSWWARKRRKEDPNQRIMARDFEVGENAEMLALDSVSFEVGQGEVLGVIGKNGAGKSTLLKILSRVTAPTSGIIRIRGRVASLLEVGTGFHPELTGRENVYLNGSILGMTKTEIAGKFDEIVSFSGMEKFIDTPVKRYSSGMTVRLAFAVAAHLEPEVLMIDEVLAVGDQAFQKKCIGKMQDVARAGRTVLFVSHNMTAVRNLCERAILLEQGKIEAMGDIDEVVDRYIDSGNAQGPRRQWKIDNDPPGNENITLLSVMASAANGAKIDIDSGILINVEFFCHKTGINLDCTIYLLTRDDVVLFESGCLVTTNNDSRTGKYSVQGSIPGHVLNAGSYKMSLLFGENQRYPLFRFNEVISFDVENTVTERGSNFSIAPGVIRPKILWISDFQGDS